MFYVFRADLEWNKNELDTFRRNVHHLEEELKRLA